MSRRTGLDAVSPLRQGFGGQGSAVRLGVDFDNTLVCYDALFVDVARERGFLPDGGSFESKRQVRDYLVERGDGARWTELQGFVYGSFILRAPAFPGALDFVASCARSGVTLAIVRHKSRYPALGPRVDLHLAAAGWLREKGLRTERVFFELTREAKLHRIAELALTHFVDDLKELLVDDHFPRGVRRILFDPHDEHEKDSRYDRVTSFRELASWVQP